MLPLWSWVSLEFSKIESLLILSPVEPKYCNHLGSKYYSQYIIIENENTRDRNWDAAALKSAGWGDAYWSGQGNTSAYAKREMGYELEGTGSATAAYEYGEGR